jgi:hypothetical protein
MAALAAAPDNAVALFEDKMRPVLRTDPALLDRIFRDLDAPEFAVRDKADRALNQLGVGALAGARERAGKSQSAEVKQRANRFLRRFDNTDIGPDRIRIARALEVLAMVNTPGARKLVETLAAGALEVWETEIARRTLGAMTQDNQKQ